MWWGWCPVTVSRRDFIKAAGAGTVAGLASSTWGRHRRSTPSRRSRTRSSRTRTATGSRCTTTSTRTTRSTGRSVTPTARSRVR
ncbi:twin-arginine translocation signal domain-containing protein [Halobaculum litoreum]|uniref:Twin-arginine translocation signal domain-containing protein n=1 Tax=Halobaculum litoreum TaxID=3031998 RepID=A0ABD5XMF3_9EURY